VAGAHLLGQPLNHQLTDRGGRLIETTTTSARYSLFALATDPPKPGLVWQPEGGGAIEVERWRLPASGFASFIAQVPPPMAIGAVELTDGSWCTGFTCMPHALVDARDITASGGWRAHLAGVSTAGG
jgi:allophanate hydrolase